MARNGVWELKEITLRYCATSGSSEGVRSFVENGLISFSKRNPQIHFRTKIQGGHPCVFGSYITGYERQRGLKKMSSKEVQEVLEELRDTLGRRVPKHNEIGIGVVEKKCVSVQGIWRNAPDLWYPELPETAETRERRSQTHGLQTLFDDVGITGVISTTQKLLDREATAKQLALDALPRAERILPTE